MSVSEQNVLAFKMRVPFDLFQDFRTINVEHGNSSVYICVHECVLMANVA